MARALTDAFFSKPILNSPYDYPRRHWELDETGQPTGGYLIALDAIGAGKGETVLVLDEGNGARQILGDSNAPVRSVVVGIVDAVELESS